MGGMAKSICLLAALLSLRTILSTPTPSPNCELGITGTHLPTPSGGRPSPASVRVVVREFNQGTSNMYTYGAKLIQHTVHTLENDGRIHLLREGVPAIFDDKRICVSVKKLIVLDESGPDERYIYSCEKKCFALNETAVLMTKVEEGGELKWGRLRLCCVWTTETWLEIAVEKPIYKCALCQGTLCNRNKTALINCPPGEGCVSVSFTGHVKDSRGTFPLKGCTDHQLLHNRGCWNGCKRLAANYEMCIHCCYGDGCNRDVQNATSTTPLKVEATQPGPRKGARRNGGQSQLPGNILISLVATVMALIQTL